MNAVTRDRGARSRIREFLATGGPVEDTTGRATAVLKDAVEYSGSQVGFIQLVAAMERDGEITREIRGKRTYKIRSAASPTVTGNAAAAGAPLGVRLDLDYEKLARALLREVSRVMTSDLAGAKSETQSELTSVVNERDQLRAERDAYAARLGVAREQISLILGEYVGAPPIDAAEGGSEEQAS